jgi:hypothetical protein
MQIKTWHVVLFLTVTSCALVIAEIPRDTWLTSAALSLALGVAAVAMMGAAALLRVDPTVVSPAAKSDEPRKAGSLLVWCLRYRQAVLS